MVIVVRTEAVRAMPDGIHEPSLESLETGRAAPYMSTAGESCLRRAREALVDLVRHVLAEGFGRVVAE